MALLRYLPFILYAAVTIYTIVDIALIERYRVRALPKVLWILFVIVLPVVGTALWFLLGRERLPDGGSTRPVRRGPAAPDDDPEFLHKLSREQQQEDRIRDLEERLRRIDDDKPKE